MKRRRVEPRVLLAEGKDEQFALPELLELGGIPWPEKAPPVWLEQFDGVERLLVRSTLQAELNASGLEALALVVDANGNPAGRWQRIHALLTDGDEPLRPGFPDKPDPVGTIHELPGQPRLGVWLMPDNLRAGMFETLLAQLRAANVALDAHVLDALAVARTHGAPYRDVHRDKAALHTWLAWQDPPGQAISTAAKARAFDTSVPAFAPFIAWARRLFEV